MQTPTPADVSAASPGRIKRTRISKYPPSDPRYWMNHYTRNGLAGRPTYEGIPEAMHEPIRAHKRAVSRKQRVKKQRKEQRRAQRTFPTLQDLQAEMGARYDAAYAASPHPLAEVPPPATAPSLWPAHLLAFVLFAVGIFYSSIWVDVARRSDQAMERRIARIEAAVALPHATLEKP